MKPISDYKLELVPVREEAEQNAAFARLPEGKENLQLMVDYFKRVGYQAPWTGYFVKYEQVLVGTAAFSGAPVNGSVEISYGTFASYQNQGIGQAICRALVRLALDTDPEVQITARTLPEENFSTRILQKNHFVLTGMVQDPEDGEVWEWVYVG